MYHWYNSLELLPFGNPRQVLEVPIYTTGKYQSSSTCSSNWHQGFFLPFCIDGSCFFFWSRQKASQVIDPLCCITFHRVHILTRGDSWWSMSLFSSFCINYWKKRRGGHLSALAQCARLGEFPVWCPGEHESLFSIASTMSSWLEVMPTIFL